MASEVESYLEARAAFERVSSQTTAILQSVIAVAAALRANPARFMFSNCQPGMPMEAAMGRDAVSFDAGRWPTAQQIQASLADWHASKSRMESAWHAVPQGIRGGLQPPSTMQPR